MSNSSCTIENAAPATPVNPGRATGADTGGGGVGAPTPSRPDAPPACPACPVGEAAHDVMPSVAFEQDIAGDQLKYPRGPAVIHRPHGPSLLTQALATARGIPLPNHTEPSH